MADVVIAFDWDTLPKLYQFCEEVAKRNRKDGSADLRSDVQRLAECFGIDDVDALGRSIANGKLAEGLGVAFDEEGSRAIAELLTRASGPVMTAFVSCAQGKTSLLELNVCMEELRRSLVGDLELALRRSLHVPDGAADLLSEKLGPYTVSVYCFAAAYKIYAQASRDYEAARERRVEAERLAQQTIRRLKAEREELDAFLGKYFLDRLVPFSEGVAAMDRAMLTGDDDGFVEANAALWEAFGHEAQYRNKEEFDELMLSDEAFRL